MLYFEYLCIQILQKHTIGALLSDFESFLGEYTSFWSPEATTGFTGKKRGFPPKNSVFDRISYVNNVLDVFYIIDTSV